MKLLTTTRGPEETQAIAALLAPAMVTGDVIALEGDLGAGKTTFVRGLAEAIGIEPNRVSSPTFILVQEYESDDVRTLVHVDAYRISDESELDAIGWDEMLEQRDAVVVIEWPERVSARLPREMMVVRLVHAGQDERDVEIVIPESWRERFAMIADRWPGQIISTDSSSATQSPPTSDAVCPVCEEALVTSEHHPFCSERCRLVDLGRWFHGRYSISRPLRDDDEFEL